MPKPVLQQREADLTRLQVEGRVIIPHICNDVGLFGAGFAAAVAQRWPEARDQYLAWFEGRLGGAPLELGHVQLVRVETSLWVANMIAQHGVGRRNQPIRYEALETALSKVAERALRLGASVHMPRIGTGLAGGDWARIEEVIRRTLLETGVPVSVYTLPPRRGRGGRTL